MSNSLSISVPQYVLTIPPLHDRASTESYSVAVTWNRVTSGGDYRTTSSGRNRIVSIIYDDTHRILLTVPVGEYNLTVPT